MSDKMTQDKALARIMELHKVSPSEDEMRRAVRKILSAFGSAKWSEGYYEGIDL